MTKQFFSEKSRILVSALLITAFFPNFTDKTAPYLSGLSPYHSAAVNFEEKAFLQFAKDRRLAQLTHEDIIKAKILKIASNFRTGLGQRYLHRLPGWIIEASRRYGYDPLFLTAIIITESSFNHRAKSRKGALGLMQITLRTGYAIAFETQVKWKGKKTLYHPETNIALGAYYLDKLVSRYGDLSLALEAYNHGPTQLNRYLRKGFRPTLYSEKVFGNYKRLRSKSI